MLAVLGLASTWAWPLPAGSEAHRNAVFWGLPCAAFLLSLLLVQPSGRRRPRRSRGWVALPPILLLVFLLDQSYLGIAWLVHLATFTSGSQSLADAKLFLVSAWALPALAVLSVFGIERCLRLGIYRGITARWPAWAAFAVSAGAGLALALPAVLPGGEARDLPFAAAMLAAALCREGLLTLVFLRGGLLASGLLRALFLWVEGLVINDGYGLFFGSFQFASESPMLYAVRVASAVVALISVVPLLPRAAPGEGNAA